MKKSLLTLLSVLVVNFTFSQGPPQKINYQAVARDLAGNPLINTTVNVSFDIKQSSASGVVVYSETHTNTTNAFGLFTAEIGGGTPTLGTFTGINWGVNLHYLQVTVNGDVMQATQLLSVPYALHAGTAASGTPGVDGIHCWDLNGNGFGDVATEDINGDLVVNVLDCKGNNGVAGTNGVNGNNGISISWQGTHATPLSTPNLNEAYYNSTDGIAYIWDGSLWQTLAKDGVGSAFVAGPGLSIVGNTISVTDTSVTNELQTISLNSTNDTIFLTNGGFVELPNSSSDTDWTQGNGIIYNTTDNVGIGTNTPIFPLHIFGGTSQRGSYIEINGSNSSSFKTAVTGLLENGQGSGDNIAGAFNVINGSSPKNIGVEGYATGGTGDNYGVWGMASGASGNNWAGYFTGGNVHIQNNLGIGTTSPLRKLHVETSINGGGGILVNNTNPTGNVGLELQTQGVSRFVLGVDQNDNNKFKIAPSNAFTNTRFTIDSQGNVGIGTTLPLSKLSVVSTDSVIASFSTNNSNFGAVTIRNSAASAPLGTILLSGLDTAIFGMDPSVKQLVVTNKTVGGHVTLSADSSVTLYGINIANSASDMIFNKTKSIYNNVDTIINLSNSGAIFVFNQGTFLTDSLYVRGNNFANAGYVLTNNGFGKAEWQLPVSGPTYTAGTGINIATNTITNTAPDQTVILQGVGSTSITGTYPNFTISSTDNVNDADANPTNELVTSFGINGPNLELIDAGGTYNIALSSLAPNDGDWSISGNNMSSNVSGFVGVGTSTPSSKLHVYQPAGAGEIMLESPVGGNLKYSIKNTNTAYAMELSGTNLHIRQSGTNLMTFSSGRVGINGAPSYSQFEVNGQVTMRTGAANGYVPVSDANGTMTWTDPSSLSSSFWQGVSASSDIYFNTGNVGIGIGTPNFPLDIRTTSNNKGAYIEVSGQNSTSNKIGVIGISTGGLGTGINKGGAFNAIGGSTGDNYGVDGIASGGGADQRGVNASAIGGSGINYGIYASASGGTNNYAGFFDDGDVYIENDLGIGTNSPSQKLDVAGNITSDDYLYNSVQTHYQSFSWNAFQSVLPQTYLFGQPTATSDYGQFVSGGSSFGYANASINLPDGAVITELRAWIWDNGASNPVRINLYRQTLGTSSGIQSGQIESSSATALSSVQNLSTPLSVTIDNASNSYYLTFTGKQNSADTRLYGVRITYTVTKAD